MIPDKRNDADDRSRSEVLLIFIVIGSIVLISGAVVYTGITISQALTDNSYMTVSCKYPRNYQSVLQFVTFNESGKEKRICLRSDNSSNCEELVPSKNNIFFLETSCAANTSENLNKTQHLSDKTACAMYSAARYNPTRKVIFLITCSIPDQNWTVQWNVLLELPNFFFAQVDLDKLYANTPLADFSQHCLAKSKYPVEHHSDILRFYILYMYGGTYLGFDIISVKSLDDLGHNYLVKQATPARSIDGVSIASSGLNFKPNHIFPKKCLLEATKEYFPTKWTSVGPDVLTRVLYRDCQAPGHPNSSMHAAECQIRIHPSTTFFAIPYSKWKQYYSQNSWNYVRAATKNSTGIHYWNHMGNYTLYVGSSQPIVKFAEQHCPPVYRNAGKIFS